MEKIKANEPKEFAIFCKKCGSYEIDIFLDIDDAIVLNCKACDIEEEI
jgi:translation initiation factor 2 beta subunit (eIF-2beta)/eIF-5